MVERFRNAMFTINTGGVVVTPLQVLLLAMLFCLIPGQVWSASLTATVERKTVIDGESVLLYIEGENLKSLPDTSALNRRFDIVDSRSSNSQILGNGGLQSKFTLRFELLPKHLGKTEIPAFEADGQVSQPIIVEVVERGTAGTVPRDNVFAEVTLSDDSPYVQSQVVLSLHIFDDGKLATADPVIPAMANVQIEPLPVGKQRLETRDGVEYRVHTWRYALFPQKSGTLELPRLMIAGSVKDPSYGGNLILRNTPTRRISIRTRPVSIDVRPKPPQSTAAWWLPAEQLELRHKWSTDISKARVGDPLTLTLQLAAKGTTSTQLPEIDLADVEGLKIYPDVPELLSQPKYDGLISQRGEKWSIIPQRAGQVELPEIKIKWWDTTANVEREAVFEAQSIAVAAAEGAVAAVQPPLPVAQSPEVANESGQALLPESAELTEPEQEAPVKPVTGTLSLLPDRHNGWMWIAVALATGWLITTLCWILTRRRKPVLNQTVEPAGRYSKQQRQALKDLKILSRSGSASAFRQSLMTWSAFKWPDNPPLNLAEIGKRLYDAELSSSLHSLDAAVYSSAGNEVSLQDLHTRLLQSLDNRAGPSKSPSHDPLPQL